ncbi:MAG: hypothetical protein O9311_08065 [Cytophagales bacterium]|nr:hypothetical protein [Cytophagales bacterium]
MHGVDPMADKYSSLTPYNYSYNMPNMVVDVNGADPADRDPANYWFEESMQRRAAQGRGEPQSNTGLFAGLYRSFGQSLFESRTIGGFSASIGAGAGPAPFGVMFNSLWDGGFENLGGIHLGSMAMHDSYYLTKDQYVAKYGERISTGMGMALMANYNMSVLRTEMLKLVKGIGDWRLMAPTARLIAKYIPLIQNSTNGFQMGLGAGPMPDLPEDGIGEDAPNSAFTLRGNGVGVANLFFEFITGTGPEYSMFLEGHPMVKEMKNAYIVDLAKIKFVLGGYKPLLQWDAPFGVVGAALTGKNLTAQFIGGARISILPTADGNMFIIDNTTGRYSFEGHSKPDIPRHPSILTPEGNIYQRLIWFEKK